MKRHPAPFDGAALRAARLRRGLTQHQLAQQLGVAGGERVSRWELGATRPRAATIARLAVLLDVGVDELVPAGGVDSGLRALRTRTGLTAAELAEAAHVSISSVQRWESGEARRPLPRQTAQVVARVLGVSVEEIDAAITG